MLKRCVFVIGAMLLAHPVLAQPAAPARPAAAIPTVEDRVSGLKKIDGYFPLYWEERTGSMLLEIPRFDAEFLFSTGLSAGLGSNDLGLDRGQGGQGRIVTFQRVGPRVMLVQGNQSFRSSSKNPLERKSVEDSFAKSVLWGFTVAAESNGKVLVDATDFLLRDVHGAGRGLRPGTFRVDRTRSALYLPEHQELPQEHRDRRDAHLRQRGGRRRAGWWRWSGAGAGGDGSAGSGGRVAGAAAACSPGSVASVTPSPDSVTLREHVSLVELPDGNYKPRYDDPRAGYGGLSFVDYSVPIGEPIVRCATSAGTGWRKKIRRPRSASR